MKYVSFSNKVSFEYKRGFEAGKKEMEKTLKLALYMQKAIFDIYLEVFKRQKITEEHLINGSIVPPTILDAKEKE